MHAVGDALHAVPNGGSGISEIADQHPDHRLAGPSLYRELAKSVPCDAPGRPVIGSVERRSGQWVNQSEPWNGCSREAARYLAIRIGIVVVLDEEVDLGSDPSVCIRDGTRRIA